MKSRSLIAMLRARSHHLRDIGSNTLVTYIGMALSLVSAPLVVQAVGADGRGVLAGSFALVQVLTYVAPLGLTRGMAMQLQRRREVSVWGLIVMTGMGILAAAMVLVLAPFLSGGDDRIAFGMQIAALLLPLQGVANLGASLSIMSTRTTTYNLIRASTLIVPSGVQVLLFVLGALTLPLAYAAMLLGTVLAVVVGTVAAIIAIRGAHNAPVPWGFSLRTWASTLSESLASRLDIAALTMFAPASAVGVYAIAMTCSNAAGGVTQAINRVGLVKFVHEPEDSKDSLRSIGRVGVIASTVSGVLVLALVSLLWNVLFGAEFGLLPLLVALLLVGRSLQDQWALRIHYETARESAGVVSAASLCGLVTLVLVITTLVLLQQVNEVSVALAFCAGVMGRMAAYALLTRGRMSKESLS